MRIRVMALGWSLAAALAVGPLGSAAAPARASTSAPAIQLNTGRGQLVTLTSPMSDLFIADDTIADVQVRSPTQLYLFGKKAGETTVSATTKSGAVVFSATIQVGNNYDSIGRMLALAMPEAKVVSTPMNGFVLLTGTVAAPEDSAEAERLVQAFVGKDTQVISRLKTATPMQVNLQVRFAEVNRNFMKNVGVNIISGDHSGGFQFGVGQGRAFSPQFAPGGPLGTGVTTGDAGTSLISTVEGNTTLGLAGHLLGLDLLSAIDLGETTGQVTTLANPNLTALSGETGTFLAGGEVPIPVTQGLGGVGIEYKQYGVSLAYTPTVLSDGRISLRVRPEVSQLDYSNAVTMGGTRVPGLTTRRAETTVELGSGQSFMIGGLLQNSQNNSITKAPFLGDIPILGSLFRSNSFQRNESELVIVITPYLVKPVNGTDIALPTDGYKAPNDASRILLGELGSGVTEGQRPKPITAPAAQAAPAFGASAPVPSAPVSDDRRKVAATSPATRKDKADASPAPGFSGN